MRISYCHLSQTERFIAAGQVTTVALPLFAVCLHPAEPVRHALLIDSLPIGHLMFATILVVAFWYLFNMWNNLAVVVRDHFDKSISITC